MEAEKDEIWFKLLEPKVASSAMWDNVLLGGQPKRFIVNTKCILHIWIFIDKFRIKDTPSQNT
jgi:hypothetical protein